MGLFKKLQNGDTQLKSLKFGHDRPGGGDSNQPYIQKDLETESNKAQLSGNALSISSALEDASRLTKYFTDNKNPSGILFTAKQNILSRTNVKTEASPNIFNGGFYNPLTTIKESGLIIAGQHLNKQTGETYQEVIKSKQPLNDPKTALKNNRLFNLTKAIFNYFSVETGGYTLFPGSNTLLSYKGGPNSNLGFGTTKIKYDPANLTLNSTAKNPELSKTIFSTWNYQQFQSISGSNKGEILEDFRKSIPKTDSDVFYLTSTEGYKDKNIESTFGLGNPGSRNRDRSNQQDGSKINKKVEVADLINASFLYKSSNGPKPFQNGETDIIPFSIAILNNDNQNRPGENTNLVYKKYMHFRAFIDSFSDSYDAEWKAINYMGRAEKLYKYSGFDRKISMGFTVAAQSKPEMMGMYEKLNYLASSLAPEYLDTERTGYMAGNIAYITLGDYINDQPGIITSLTFEIPEESPWEINLEKDKNTQQLPFIIKVNLNFTPIHKFRPSKKRWETDITTEGDHIPTSTTIQNPEGQNFISKYIPSN